MGTDSPQQPDLIQRGPATAQGGCDCQRALEWEAWNAVGESIGGPGWRGGREADGPEWTRFIRCRWRVARRWEGVYAEAQGNPKIAGEASQAAFITDRAYGYSVCRGATVEYVVEHPPWRVWEDSEARLVYGLWRMYGETVGGTLGEPCSAFVAEGSSVVVRRGRRLVA